MVRETEREERREGKGVEWKGKRWGEFDLMDMPSLFQVSTGLALFHCLNSRFAHSFSCVPAETLPRASQMGLYSKGTWTKQEVKDVEVVSTDSSLQKLGLAREERDGAANQIEDENDLRIFQCWWRNQVRDRSWTHKSVEIMDKERSQKRWVVRSSWTEPMSRVSLAWMHLTSICSPDQSGSLLSCPTNPCLPVREEPQGLCSVVIHHAIH